MNLWSVFKRSEVFTAAPRHHDYWYSRRIVTVSASSSSPRGGSAAISRRCDFHRSGFRVLCEKSRSSFPGFLLRRTRCGSVSNVQYCVSYRAYSGMGRSKYAFRRRRCGHSHGVPSCSRSVLVRSLISHQRKTKIKDKKS